MVARLLLGLLRQPQRVVEVLPLLRLKIGESG
jgi:hypothetical protein